jgi:DNA helicase IV
MKSNNYSFADLKGKNLKLTNESDIKRNEVFFEIVEPLYNGYNEYLKLRGEIDFSDMINKAADYINSGKVNVNYKYIIIDEFQDLSVGRYKLLKAIKKQKPGLQNICCRR